MSKVLQFGERMPQYAVPVLNEIQNYNPLLFDFVLKRTMRHPETKQKLAASVFMQNPGLE